MTSMQPPRLRPLIRKDAGSVDRKGRGMKYMILIYGNPENWGHPTFLRTPEALTMPEQQRDQLTTQFVQLMEETRGPENGGHRGPTSSLRNSWPDISSWIATARNGQRRSRIEDPQRHVRCCGSAPGHGHVPPSCERKRRHREPAAPLGAAGSATLRKLVTAETRSRKRCWPPRPNGRNAEYPTARKAGWSRSPRGGRRSAPQRTGNQAARGETRRPGRTNSWRRLPTPRTPRARTIP